MWPKAESCWKNVTDRAEPLQIDLQRLQCSFMKREVRGSGFFRDKFNQVNNYYLVHIEYCRNKDKEAAYGSST